MAKAYPNVYKRKITLKNIREPSPDDTTPVVRLSNEQTCALLTIYQSPNSEYFSAALKKRIFEKIYSSYYKLILKTLTKGNIYYNTNDLYQECIITLHKCMMHFDVTRGFKFSTYLWNSVMSQRSRYFYYVEKRKTATLSKEVEANLFSTYDHEAEVSARLAQEEFYRILKACFSSSRYQRLALILYARVLGKTYEEITTLAGISSTGKPLTKERVRQLCEDAFTHMKEYYGYR